MEVTDCTGEMGNTISSAGQLVILYCQVAVISWRLVDISKYERAAAASEPISVSSSLESTLIQSFNTLVRTVIFLRYAANPQINKYPKLLTPIGKPTTISLINPAIKINPYPKLSSFFKLQ